MVRKYLFCLILIWIFLAACSPTMQPTMILPNAIQPTSTPVIPELTPFPTRPAYEPGQLVEYTAQSGDTLPALAVRFNTTVEEIRQANPNIPEDATTMPPGMPMQIPIYFRPLWGNPFQILPDAAFVNGPAVSEFDTGAYLNAQSGWLSSYSTWAFNGTRSAGEMIDYVAFQYSISPKLLIALLEYQGGGCSLPELDESLETNILGLESSYWTGVYLQLSYAANILNDGYYRWRDGELIEFELLDGSLVRPDPWQNAGSVALQFFFSKVLTPQEFHYAISSDGFAKVYQGLFGAPWDIEPLLPGSLVQPDMQLPYINDIGWAFTGGPHTGWGSMAP